MLYFSLILLPFALAQNAFHDPHAEHVMRNPQAYKPYHKAAYVAKWEGNVHTDCVDQSMVALTFDDGVNEGTENVLRFLKKHQISATFFILGSQVDRRVLRKIVDAGHVVGSHSWDHPSFVHLSEWDMKWQLDSTADAIYSACRRRPKFFRPPFGEVDWRVTEVLNNAGYEVVNWNIDSNDWHGDAWAAASNIRGGISGEWSKAMERRGKKWRGGYIVLQHDAYFQDFVGEATIKAAKRAGKRFVTIAECLGMSEYQNQREVDREKVTSSSAKAVVTKTTSVTPIKVVTVKTTVAASTVTRSAASSPRTQGIPTPVPLSTVVPATSLPPVCPVPEQPQQPIQSHGNITMTLFPALH